MDVAEVGRPLPREPQAHLERERRAVFTHHERIEGVDPSRRLFDEVAVPQREGIAVHHDGAVCPSAHGSAIRFQVAGEPTPVLEERGAPAARQELEVECLEARRMIRLREGEERLVTRSETAPRQVGDERAEMGATLLAGDDGEHLEDVALARADRHERPALEDAHQVVEPRFELEALRLDEGARTLRAGAAEDLAHHRPALAVQPSAAGNRLYHVSPGEGTHHGRVLRPSRGLDAPGA